MHCWQCNTLAAAIFGMGLGMVISLLFTSCVLVGLIGVILIAVGILLIRKK